MNQHFVAERYSRFDCSGNSRNETEWPGQFYHVPDYQTGTNIFDDDITAGKLSNLYKEQSRWDIFEDNLGLLKDNYSDTCMEEFYSIEDIALCDQLRHMNLSRQFEELQSAEANLEFMKQQKKHQLGVFLCEEEKRWVARRKEQQHTIGDNFNAQLLEEDEEKVSSSGQRSFMNYYSDQGSSSNSTTQLDTSSADDKQHLQGKSKHCRHFLKGYCKRGTSCGFIHDKSVFCSNTQKVFLGGLPSHLTRSMLRQKLMEQGLTVLNRPKIHKWYSPQVCLGSVEEAQRLIQKGTIDIDGTVVKVRAFGPLTHDMEKKLPDEVERSVFLGGLSEGTTAKIIKDELTRKGLVF
eukprot:TRINITY_DN105_c0_g1_i5.p1 TRINITY_DN105_c0_g1~~TRINITY_DN105_c0_g1_i5.p1  ORF type:complete len:349 (-),score=65.86 TRINITY_DN105_c0_g1_i5:215-1261(-)